MSIIYFLVPIAIIFIIIAIGIFFWAVRSDQFKDLERHGHSILFDDDLNTPLPKAPTPKNTSINNTSEVLVAVNLNSEEATSNSQEDLTTLTSDKVKP